MILRRQLLGGLGASLAVGGAAGGTGLGPASLRLCWIYNSEFAGEFHAASKGYYRDEGFSEVTLAPGGPGSPPADIDVVQGRSLLGITAIDLTAAAINEGASLRTIGAQYQKTAFCIVSLASRPILEPKAMIGRTIGVQPSNQTIFATFLGANGIDPDRVRSVPVQFDPTPLLTGDVDGWLGYVTNEPNTLRARGFAPAVCLFSDFHYPLLMQTYVTTAESVATRRPALKAMLRAEIRGWRDNLRDPDEGARLSCEVYGRRLGLNPASERLQSRTENGLLTGPRTVRHGLFAIGPEQVEGNVATLRGMGLDVTAATLFDLSLLEEIYQDDPSLLVV